MADASVLLTLNSLRDFTPKNFGAAAICGYFTFEICREHAHLGIGASLSDLRFREARNHADQRMPVLLRVHELSRSASAEAR